MVEVPSTGRSEISQDFDTLKIEIPSKKKWFIIILMTAWMGGWVMGEAFAISSVFFLDEPFFVKIFLAFWLIGWTCAGAFVSLIILWQLKGREIITIENSIMKVERKVYKIGFPKNYDIKSINSIGINPSQNFSFFGGGYFSQNIFGFKNGKIKFDYGMSTIKIANDIEEAEAKTLIQKLKDDKNFSENNFT